MFPLFWGDHGNTYVEEVRAFCYLEWLQKREVVGHITTFSLNITFYK